MALAVRETARFGAEFLDELRSLFRDDFDGVGGEQLVIAERGGDGAAMFVVFEARFDVVAAVASRLEAVNPHHLVLGQTRSLSDLGIDLFERDVALRRPRHEIELLLRGGDKISDDRDRNAVPRRLRL